MLRAGGSSPAPFPSIDFDLPATAQPVTPAATGATAPQPLQQLQQLPQIQTPQLPAGAAAVTATLVSLPDQQKQDYIERAVRQLPQTGVASGLTHPDPGAVPDGLNMESRDVYMAYRASPDGGNVVAVQAAAEWNQIAIDFARQRAAAVFEQFRQDYVRAQIMSVLKSGIASGLTLFGRNIESREGFIASRIVGNAQRDMMIQSKRAESDWNKLAAAYTKDSGEKTYARLYPIDPEGTDVFASPMVVQQKQVPDVAVAQPHTAAAVATQPGAANATSLDELFPPIPGFGDAGTLDFAPQSLAVPLEFAPAIAAPVAEKLSEEGEMEAADAVYQSYLASLASVTAAALADSMKKLSDLILFQIHTDQTLKGHPLDPHGLAAKILLAR